MTTLVQIPFHGTRIEAHLADDDLHVVFRPIVESLGLEWSSQLRRIKRSPWASHGHMNTTGSDGKNYDMVTVTRRTLTMWLATIQASRVNPNSQELLAAFQNESADVLDKHWHNGIPASVNPAPVPELTLSQKTRDQIELLGLARGLVDQNWLEGKARIVLARALDEIPETPDHQIPLYVESYLNEKSGLTAAQAKTLRSIFGRKVSAAYKAHHSRAPQKSPGEVGSRIREINAYVEADRWLFDQVWNDDYEVLFGATLFHELSA
ncbi:hypothetical protein AOC05_05050 [Arthrobacter alpinus]|uniref:Antirepressor protein ant N-terminal domain-containing protein n=1 Tax=Arthrobacter alpinus TaxID=656366 RepID=A0A0M4QXH5_9MICC|nr:phage antirepressor N-terminal domain-containing protein [Arthrobacter alpinus]ALE91840.1 hypothetical protein AOC05_05050 [Arthrobacter alpinus]